MWLKWTRLWTLAALLCLPALAMTACDNDSPMEQLGEDIEDAAD